MQMHIFKKALLPLMATVTIFGCSNDNKSIEDVIGAVGSISTTGVSQPVVKFSPSGSVLPFPTDILLSGTPDGSLNIPLTDEEDNALFNYNQTAAPTAAELASAGSSMPRVAMNTVDGFSTTASMVFSLGALVDTTNIDNGTAVRVFKSDTQTTAFNSSACVFLGVCTGFDAGTKTTWSLEAGATELIFGVDFVVSAAADGAGGMSVAVLPLKPLAPSSTYMVLVTKDMPLVSDATKNIRGDLEYRIAQSTTPVLYLTRDLFTELGGAVGMAGIETALSLPPGTAAPVFTKADTTALEASDSCVFVKGVADLIDAAGALPTPISFNIDTDCKPALSAITVLRDNGKLDNSTAFSFESLRIQISAQEAALATFTAANPNPAAAAVIPVTSENMALTFSFTTQNVGAALINAKTQVAATAPSINIHNEISKWGAAPSLALTSPGADGDLSTPADASANVFVGTLNDIVQFVDPADKNGSFWKASTTTWADPSVIGPTSSAACLAGFPDLAINAGSENLVPCNGFTPAMVNATHDIPVIISVPNAATLAANATCTALQGAAGYPILIYQHGITTHRGTIMAIADAMAKACVAVVAIDLPKHGILPSNDPFGASDLATFYQAAQTADGITAATDERLVQMPAASGCQTQASPAPDFNPGPQEIGSTGVFACPSADRYINLENLANARDTFRQGVVDLHSLYKVLSTDAFSPADVGAVIDKDNIHFLGMSLGGITGMPFAAQESGLQTVALNVASGGISKVVDGSASFEPAVVAGLAAAGVVKPSADYETFLIATQTMLDSADPMNMTGQIGTAEDASTFWAGLTASAGTARPVLFQEVVGVAGATDGDGTCNASLDDGVDNSGCPDLSVPNNTFMNSSLATAWGAVSNSGQTGALPGQNPVTIPVALSGTDVLTQGTAFVALATAGLLGDPLAATGAPTFSGMALPEVGSAGLTAAQASGVVRFTAGEHGSLLSPNPGGLDAAAVATSNAFFATAAMQTQISVFVATGGAVIAGTGTTPAFSTDPTTNAALGSVIK
jgi:hypothetical protein